MTESRSLGAAELLRSVGLIADGPVRWGNPVRAAGPGVYLVELAEPLKTAPIDHTARGPLDRAGPDADPRRCPAHAARAGRPDGRVLAARRDGRVHRDDQPVDRRAGRRFGEDRAGRSPAALRRPLAEDPDRPARAARLVGPDHGARGIRGRAPVRLRPGRSRPRPRPPCATRVSSCRAANLQSATDERKPDRDQGRAPRRRGRRTRHQGRASRRCRLGR